MWSLSEPTVALAVPKAAMSDIRQTSMEPDMTTDVAYAICSFNDIPSHRAMGFQLMIVAEDGSQRPWPIFVIRWG